MLPIVCNGINEDLLTVGAAACLESPVGGLIGAASTSPAPLSSGVDYLKLRSWSLE